MSGQNIAFLIVLCAALGFFSYNIQRLVSYLRLGKPENRLDHPGRRTWNLLTIGFAQTKILREKGAGLSHASVFWGFLVLTAGTVEILLHGVWPAFSYEAILPRPIWQLFMLSQELFAVVVLVAVGWLLWRRLVAPPKRPAGQGDPRHRGGDHPLRDCVADAHDLHHRRAGVRIRPVVASHAVRLVPPDLDGARLAPHQRPGHHIRTRCEASGCTRCWSSASSTSCRTPSTCTSSAR